MSLGEREVLGTCKSRPIEYCRVGYARSSASINGRLGSRRGSSDNADVTEACEKGGNPVFPFISF